MSVCFGSSNTIFPDDSNPNLISSQISGLINFKQENFFIFLYYNPDQGGEENVKFEDMCLTA